MTDKAGDNRSGTNAGSGKFKRTMRESEKVWAQYEADQRAVRARTERLRSLRLAKEAAEVAAAPPATVLRKTGKKGSTKHAVPELAQTSDDVVRRH